MINKKTNIGQSKSEVVQEEILKQNPEGLPEASADFVSPDSEIVISNVIPPHRRVIFVNNRDPGYPLEFRYHSKACPLKAYTLFHGQEVDLPEEIITHLEGLGEMQYGDRIGPGGRHERFVSGKKFYYQLRNAPKKAA